MISILRVDKTSSMLNSCILIILGIILLLSTLVYVYAGPPMERVERNYPVLKDQSDRELSNAGVGEVVMIESVLKANPIKNQTLAYIVQIKDVKEVTVFLSWLDLQLRPSQELKASQSWVPMEQGHYLIETFVWSSIYNPDPLTFSTQNEVSVFAASQPLPFDFAISTDPPSLKIKKGESSELLVIVEPLGEEIHDVKLTVPESPRGMNVKLEQDFVDNTHRHSLARITVTSSVALGTHSFDILGESNGIYRSVNVKVTVVKEDLK